MHVWTQLVSICLDQLLRRNQCQFATIRYQTEKLERTIVACVVAQDTCHPMRSDYKLCLCFDQQV